MHRYKPDLRHSERGMFIAELAVSMTMMALLVLGMTSILIVQARQQVRIKLQQDMMSYAEMILDEAELSLAGADDLTRSSTSGGRAEEKLEYNFLGSENMGASVLTRFTQEGQRKVLVMKDNQRAEFADRFPPPELDPNKNRDLRYRVLVDNFRIKSYQDRLALHPNVMTMLSIIEFKLELQDRETGYSDERLFRRVVTSPNYHIKTKRRQEMNTGL